MSHPPLARALGRIPSGLFIVTAGTPNGPIGFLGSFVQQVGFEPPTLAVAVAKGREHLAAIRASGAFAVSILDAASKHAMPPFFGKLAPGQSPFDVLPHGTTSTGAPFLTEALAWVACRVSGEHDAGDHVVVFGTAVAGELAREGDPSVHLRKNGLSY